MRKTTPAVAARGSGPPAPVRRPTVALALGGGGARGLAHVLMLEALDELGIRPVAIAGTSIGAIFGAAYASGLSAREIRAHCDVVLGERLGLLREVFAARAGSLFSLFSARSALLDPAALLELLMPRNLALDFSGLAIPLEVVASDFYAQEPVVLATGALRHAVAASMALPVVFQPVLHEGRALIDGGLVSPLPFDLLAGKADIVIAIDVSGTSVPSDRRPHPSAAEALWATAFIFERSIIREKLKSQRPDIYIEAGTGHFQVLDFLRFNDILAAAMPAKERLKTSLARMLATETLPVVEPALPAAEEPAAGRRRLLPRRRTKSDGA